MVSSGAGGGVVSSGAGGVVSSGAGGVVSSGAGGVVVDGAGSVVSSVWFVEPAGVVPPPDPPEALEGAWGAAEACVALCMLWERGFGAFSVFLDVADGGE